LEIVDQTWNLELGRPICCFKARFGSWIRPISKISSPSAWTGSSAWSGAPGSTMKDFFPKRIFLLESSLCFQ
jgi:hypothetical protein